MGRPYLDFLAALDGPAYTTDARGFLTDFNADAADLWGRQPDLETDVLAWQLYQPDGRPIESRERPLAIALKEDRVVRGAETMLKRPNGSMVKFTSRASPLHNAEGRLVGALDILTNVNQDTRAAAADAYLNAIIASSDDAIVSKDLNGIVTSWNESAERLFGFSADDIIGKSIRLIIPPDRQEEEDEVLSKVRRGIRVDHFETIRLRKDGSEVPISLTVSPVLSRDGRIVGASKIARDITERKLAERAITDALAAKDEFIGLVSHELRSPLTSIIGNSSLLVRKDITLPDDARTIATQDIHHEALRLNATIENLLSVARLERGKVDGEPVILARLAVGVVADYRSRSGRDIEIRIEVPNMIVEADDGLIRHVLENYLSNAEKYSPPHSPIVVTVDRAANRGRVRVTDRGIGVNPSETKRIFESFYRSENVGSIGGVGIGLTVCQRIVEALGGSVWAAARQEGGSEFGFELPLYAARGVDE